jgi:hypothetical protein
MRGRKESRGKEIFSDSKTGFSQNWELRTFKSKKMWELRVGKKDETAPKSRSKA